VSKRNVRALVIQLLSPFLSLCLVLLIDVSLRADAQGDRVYQNELDPKGERVGPVPHCNDDLFINAADCYFFLYAPDSSIHAKVCPPFQRRPGIASIAQLLFLEQVLSSALTIEYRTKTILVFFSLEAYTDIHYSSLWVFCIYSWMYSE
jgi:hypothetical protein